MLPGGKAPEAGDTMRNPALARTLRRIGREGREAFYEGAVARDIVSRLKELGGLARGGGFRGAALAMGRADPRLVSRLRRL